MQLLYKYVKQKNAAKKAAANGEEKPQASSGQRSQRVKTVNEIVRTAQTATLTTRSADGTVTQRGMIPATCEYHVSIICYSITEDRPMQHSKTGKRP